MLVLHTVGWGAFILLKSSSGKCPYVIEKIGNQVQTPGLLFFVEPLLRQRLYNFCSKFTKGYF